MPRNYFYYSFILFFVLLSVNAQKNKDLSIKKQLNKHQHNFDFGGRIMFDNAFFSESNLLKNSYEKVQNTSGNKFRRIFMYMSGNFKPNIEYKLQVNLINDGVGLRDAYIGLKNIPWIGKIRFGQVKEPIRLSVLNSSNYLTFMERSFLTNFFPIRNSGVLLMNNFLNHKLSYQLGVFRNSDGNTGDDKVSEKAVVVTGRLTSLVVNKTNEFLQLGLASSYRKYDDNLYNISFKPEANLSNIAYLSSSFTDVNHVNIYNSELAYSYKSLNFQGEYMWVLVNRFQNHNLFKTFYGQLSWFVTKEHKQIKNSYSGFKRLKPLQNFSKKGFGALELAFKYSYVDLNDNNIQDGIQNNMTLGVNWYLNSSVKLMLNQVYAKVKSKGNLHVSQFRVQVDF